MTRSPEPVCTDPDVNPLVRELGEPVGVTLIAADHPRRAETQAFIHAVFRSTCGADVTRFFPDLLAFDAGSGVRAAVGVRGAHGRELFAEQYLDDPAHREVAARTGRPVGRAELVEVGNLALGAQGQARWVIAAVTAYLVGAGYRWVLFTAAGRLFNAFRRLGLSPLRLAAADPRCLPDGGASWGRYYDAMPNVYAGDIAAGYAKLRDGACRYRPHLRDLFEQARALGTGSEPAAGERVSVGRARS